MKILNGTVADTPLAHVYELSDYMVISGSLYNKNPLYPLPLKFGLLDDANSSIYFKETYDVSSDAMIRYRKNGNSYVPDNKNYKVHYAFYENLGVYKMTETEEGLDIKNFSFTPTSTPFMPEYVFQTENWLIFLVKYNTTATLYAVDKSDFSLINKKDYTATFCGGLGGYYDKFEDKYYTHICIFNTANSNYVYFYSLSLTDFVQTQTYSIQTYNNQNYRYSFDIIRYSEQKSYFISTNSSTSYIYTYEITGPVKATVRYNELYGLYTTSRTDMKHYIFNPEPSYFGHIEISGSSNNTSKPSMYARSVRFNVENMSFENGWTTSSRVSSSNVITIDREHQEYEYTVCGRIKDDKTIFFANTEKIIIYKWDTEKKNYILHNVIYEDIEKIGVDSNGNVWIRNSKKDLYTLDINYSEYTIELTTDETDFDYVGKDINTFIKVRAFDKNNEDVRCHVILKLTGTAKFTENGKQIIEVDLIGEELHVPITIFDQGIVHVVYLN